MHPQQENPKESGTSQPDGDNPGELVDPLAQRWAGGAYLGVLVIQLVLFLLPLLWSSPGKLLTTTQGIVALGFLVLHAVVPIAVPLTVRRRYRGHPYVAEHARQALNLNLSFLIYFFAVLLVFSLLEFFVIAGWLILTLVGGVRGLTGKPPPRGRLILPLVK